MNNLSKAKSLFIAQKSSNKRSSSNGQTDCLFMMTEDGHVEEVKYSYIVVHYIYDEKGNVIGEEYEEKEEIHLNSPLSVKNINDKYIMVCFRDYPSKDEPTELFNYLVNKETGRCYKMPWTFALQNTVCNNYNFGEVIPNCELFMTDGEGSIYFMTYEYKEPASYQFSYPIKKIDLTDPNNITAKTVSLKNDDIDINSMPAVSKNGSVAYYGENNSSNISRYVKKDGSFFNLGIDTWSTDFWTGYDGYIYCYKDSHIYRIVETSTGVSFEQYGTRMISGGGLAFYYTKNENEGRVYLDDSKKIIKFGSEGMTEIYNEQTNEISTISFTSIGLKRPKIHASSDDFIYLYGMDSDNNNVLCRIDANNGYSKTVLMSNKYDLSSYVINDDETITFNGLRFADGAYVVGTIDRDGKETIADIVLNNEVESLINL